jgi:hypothetical protein
VAARLFALPPLRIVRKATITRQKTLIRIVASVTAESARALDAASTCGGEGRLLVPVDQLSAEEIERRCNAYPELLEMARDLAATKDETDLGVCGELLSDLADRAVKVLWTIAKEATHGR